MFFVERTKIVQIESTAEHFLNSITVRVLKSPKTLFLLLLLFIAFVNNYIFIIIPPDHI